MRILLQVFDFILDLFFPPKCQFCQGIVKSDEVICDDCWEHLPWTEDTGGVRWLIGKRGDCLAPLWYRRMVPTSICRYKFSGTKHYAKFFGELMAEVIPEGESYDLITWVPLARKRKWERGYNQAELIGRVVAEETGLEAYSTLEKWKDNVKQSSIHNDNQRGTNVAGAYRLLGAKESVAGLHILLVDDVITTGSTIMECKKILEEAGAGGVTCLGLARSRK